MDLLLDLRVIRGTGGPGVRGTMGGSGTCGGIEMLGDSAAGSCGFEDGAGGAGSTDCPRDFGCPIGRP